MVLVQEATTGDQYDEHPLARPRPGGMSQLLASRIASTAAEPPPVVPNDSRALVSARRAASTIASNVPRQSTLYVAVPAVPPALAAARAAAAAAVATGESTGAAAASAAGTALDALRKQSEKRAGPLFDLSSGMLRIARGTLQALSLIAVS